MNPSPQSAPSLLSRASAAVVNPLPECPASLLIVDDEQLNLDMLSRRLRRSGFLVEVARSGSEALEAINQKKFDLILLDQMMPVMSGSEVLQILRADHSTATLPVVMVTAVAESDKIASALEAGANDYLTKPIDFPIALARIRSQLFRKRAEHALQLSEERYALAAEASRDGLWDWNLLTDEVFYSPRWLEMVGLTREQSETNLQLWMIRVFPADQEKVLAAIREILEADIDVLQCQYRVMHVDGSLRWMSCRAVVTRDKQRKAVRLAGSQSDVTEEKTKDPLTQLPNRTLLLSYLEHACSKEDKSHAVFFIDLDGFKTINDSLGHLAGDELLRQMAQRLQHVSAQQCSEEPLGLQPICARMGGDEFAVLLQAGVTQDALRSFTEQITTTMKAPFHVSGRTLHCGFSVGIALARVEHSNPESILHDADAALYAAKARGRGEVVVFDSQLSEEASQRFILENDLSLALERGEFEIYYQPKAHIANSQIYGMEALLRWRHPTKGLLPPSTFIPIAEQTGLIVQIGHWVLYEACRQVRAWHDTHPMRPHLELSVNISPREFIQKDLVSRVARVLEKTDFPASCLHLEITESVLFEDLDEAKRLLYALKDLGVQLDLDDFGSGYSSLRYLREFPFNLIKIDRYFTLTLDPHEPSSEQLIQTIVSMADHLGLKVLAEGIETEPHRRTLQQLGCQLGQGYFFSQPVNGEQMQDLLTRQGSNNRDHDALPGAERLGEALTEAGA